MIFLGLKYHLFAIVNPSMGLGQQVIQTINNVNKNIKEREIDMGLYNEEESDSDPDGLFAEKEKQ